MRHNLIIKMAMGILSIGLFLSYLPALSIANAMVQNVQIMCNISSTPLAFTQNNGQWPDSILFRASAGGAIMWFTQNGAYYQFTRRVQSNDLAEDLVGRNPRGFDNPSDQRPDCVETIMIKASFLSVKPCLEINGQGLMKYKCNYFLGNEPDKWRIDVPNYESIVFKEIYAGIDLRYYGNGRQMEYDFIVSPGADYAQICIQYEGAESIHVNVSGELVVETAWGTVTELQPNVYQLENGEKISIRGEYYLITDNSFGFRLDDSYNPCLAVVIDPVLSYSTYLGGSDDDFGEEEIAVDGSGNAYLMGRTYSANFPTLDPYQTDQGGADFFVTKLSSSGNSLFYSTYLGGGDEEIGSGIAVDDSGNTYLTGRTNSDDFPTKDPYQTDQGGLDAFVTKLSASGNSLVYSTYLGGGSNDLGYDIVVDNSYNAYVDGETSSTDFPTQDPYQTDQGGIDVFVTKLSSDGNSLVYSTYLGGGYDDQAFGIAVDGSGNAYTTGYTNSTDFPTQDAYQTDQGDWDVFVAKLSSGGNGLIYSTYLGGADADYGYDIAIDSLFNSYIVGITWSSDFPTYNPYQTDLGSRDAFVTKLSSSGNSLVYSTYLGGENEDTGQDIAVDGRGNAYLTGSTLSTDFPTQTSNQTDQGDWDAYVTILSNTGENLIYSSYLGGQSTDYGWGIALDISDNVYITGHTLSEDFPTVNAYQANQDGWDVFIAKIESPFPGIFSLHPAPNALNNAPDTNISVTFSINMNSATINNTTLLVYGNYTGFYSGTISYDGPSRTATFDPDNDFRLGEIVTVTLSDLIESSECVPLDQGYTWQFTIEVNAGPGVLSDDAYYPAGIDPRAVVAADFNGNGNLDVAVANASNPGLDNVSLLLGKGDGSLESQITFDVGSGPNSLIQGDFDQDGDIDLAVANSASNNVSILLNHGAGSFAPQVTYSVGTNPRFIITADFDGDSYLDLATANTDDDNATILINDGDGTFTAQPPITVGDGPFSLFALDYDNDGDFDIAVSNRLDNSIELLNNPGNANCTLDTVFSTVEKPLSIHGCDFNNDGFQDLSVCSENNGLAGVYRNDGDGGFLLPDWYLIPYGACCIYAADIDGNGYSDLITTNTISNNISLLFNNQGLFGSAQSYSTGDSASFVAPADLNGDGLLDLVITEGLDNQIRVFLNGYTGQVTVQNLNDLGEGSLQWAIDSANGDPGLNTIVFNILGVLDVLTELPAITDDSIIIMGSTAPGGTHSVILDGSALGKSTNPGLQIQSSYNTIEGLTIRNFPGNGIEITGIAQNNTISNNLIYNNDLLGIDLGDNGVTTNDVGDADTGPNDLFNYPQIDSLFMNPDSTLTVYGRAADSAVIEFFIAHPGNDSTRPSDPTGYGEAYSFIGSDTCDNAGDFIYDIPKTVPQFSSITATATDILGNTSEFCENFVAISAPLIIVAYSPVNLTVTDPDGGVIGRDAFGNLTQTISPASYTEIVNDSIHINFPIFGEYIIDVVLEDGADPEAVYTIGIRIDGTEQCIVVAEAQVPANGVVTSYTYEVEEGYHYLNGDCDRNGVINILDIVYLINCKFKGGTCPEPPEVGDTNCNLLVNILDIVYLVNYKFKGGPAPCEFDHK